jgi:uncharacterized protein YndB with AHSA1/START domain
VNLGELRPAAERWQLRFVRRLAHRPEKVWRALSEPEHLAAWFPTDIEGDRVTGAALTFVFRNGEGPTLGGTMLRCEPPFLLEMQWGEEETLRFDLAPDNDGTLLTFVNTFDALGKSARNAAGWHTCLDALQYELEGSPVPWAVGERAHEVHQRYVAAFGAEAATIGPPSEP